MPERPHAYAVVAALAVAAASPACRSARPRGCGDVTGAWSTAVDGVRARLVTTRRQDGPRAVALDVENLGREPRELRWRGYVDAGFASFRLLDAGGREVPPVLAWGGNASGGELREVLPAGRAVRHVVSRELAVVDGAGRRVVRIGAFGGGWELPADGAPRFLAARVTSDPSIVPSTRVTPGADVDTAPADAPPHGEPWGGVLDVPRVCVD